MNQTNSIIASSAAQATISFAFDIDGVLRRSSDLLPGATETLLDLQKQKIPFILLTNGGGKTEADKAKEFSKILNVPLHSCQIVLSHSPFRHLVPGHQHRNVLVVGGVGNTIRDVAEAYGFKNVFATSDVFKMEEGICPLGDLTAHHHHKHGRKGGQRNSNGRIEIGLILVFTGSRDMGLDLQIIVELLLSSKGQIGTVSSENGNPDLPNNGYGQDNQPSTHFSNVDVTFSHSYALPRMAQGSFKAALDGIWALRTNGAEMLRTHVTGKPTEVTYLYGEQALQKTHLAINGPDAPPISKTYMIGDNPASDIQGANDFKSTCGVVWKSIPVETGVHISGDMPAYEPDTIVPAVQDAVQWAMQDAELE
jgi:HAD superfamily hydrolase (TIGR01456 family)